MAQLARAPALQAGGRGFEPHILHESRASPARFFDRMGERKQTQEKKTHERGVAQRCRHAETARSVIIYLYP